MKSTLKKDKDIFIEQSQYFDYRCPADARGRGISSLDIDQIFPE